MYAPQINLLYYKHILDSALYEFIAEANDFFVKVDNKYVLSKVYSKSTLFDIFQTKIISILKNYVKPYSISMPQYYFIIGACYPIDNILLKYRYDDYFPEKLSKLIYSGKHSKYVLKESDVNVDMTLLTDIFLDIFIKFFSSKSAILKSFGAGYQHIIFIMHNQLDCYSMFKVLKYIFGSKNCINLYSERLSTNPKCIIAINELIDKYVVNKRTMNKAKEFIRIVNEIKQYVNNAIDNIYT